ncbi:MAG: hypothetical protein AVDCRST_MAG66-1350, partial [uncultured Pseudonocardia sp.]
EPVEGGRSARGRRRARAPARPAGTGGAPRPGARPARGDAAVPAPPARRPARPHGRRVGAPARRPPARPHRPLPHLH